ncbi:MAG: hypothetical protein KKE50_03215 [Nanoarchaeota archaeon]|nr:hypothetical protein [Nanoarchaeota archaeon]
MDDSLKNCFSAAKKEESRGKKHKGLLVTEPSVEKAEIYLRKAKEGLKLCEVYKQMGADYKIPEEWYYALYYCGLAILSRFGIESRSQRCTALFLKYAKENNLINYDENFINRIMVYKEKDKNTDVDQREEARYGPKIKMAEVLKEYDKMMKLCNDALSQAEEIVFSNKNFDIPKDILSE